MAVPAGAAVVYPRGVLVGGEGLKGRSVVEVSSDLYGCRPKLLELLADPLAQTIVVKHQGGLMRFGCEYVETALATHWAPALLSPPM